jgi:hypothetical protein
MNRLLIATYCVVWAASGAAFSADLVDCSYLLDPNANGEAECLCAEPIEGFSYYRLGERQGDVRVTTNNPYSEEDAYVPLSIGDRAQFQNDSSALLLSAPTCQRDIHGKASLVVREVGADSGYTNVSGGSGADLAPGGTCACAALVEQKSTAGLLPVIPILGIPFLSCLDDDGGICDPDPVTPN